MKNVLAIIPARGASYRFPWHSLRNLNGYPLITYSIKLARSSHLITDYFVYTDDEEIDHMSNLLGVKSILRSDPAESTLSVSFSSIICKGIEQYEKISRVKFNVITILDSNYPLIDISDLNQAIQLVLNKEYDTVISVVKEKGAFWKESGNKFIQEFTKRDYRTKMPNYYRETGAFTITKRDLVQRNNYVGDKVNLFCQKFETSIQAGNPITVRLCEFLMNQKSIAVVLIGNSEVGLGHVYRMLSISNDFPSHDWYFFFLEGDELAAKVIGNRGHRTINNKNKDELFEKLKKLRPFLIINDILNTSKEYILKQREYCKHIINFEDIGEGSMFSDLTINALYKERKMDSGNFLWGTDYSTLRNEFLLSKNYEFRKKVQTVLITFGGTDPNNYTLMVLNTIYNYCSTKKIGLRVIIGKGYGEVNNLKKYKDKPCINLIENTNRISSYMHQVDLAFCSGGNTALELSSLAVPSIIIAQNPREEDRILEHLKLGHHTISISNGSNKNDVMKTFLNLVEDNELRLSIHKKLLSLNLKQGRKNVYREINKHLNYDEKILESLVND